MRLHPTAVAVLALVLCTGAGASEPKKSKTGISTDGAWSVRLVENGPGDCRLEVMKESAVSWQIARCVGNSSDLFFVSTDGAKVWVVKTLPENATGGGKKARKFPAWTYAEVAALYGRNGSRLKSMQLNDLVKSKEGLDDVRKLERHFKWLEGAVGVPGKGPRLTEAGTVELETVERKTIKLEF
jgi:hypothetical protein